MRAAVLTVVLACAVPAAAAFPVTPSIPLGAVNVPHTQYRVKRGDTLIDIARTVYGNGAYWRAIQKANNVKPDELEAGMVLTIPGDPEAFMQGDTSQDDAPARTGDKKQKAQGGAMTVGQLLDMLAARLTRLLSFLNLTFEDGPLFGLKVAAAVFLTVACIVLSDSLMFWFGSNMLHFPDATLRRAAKVSVGSAGMQILGILCLLVILAVASQSVPSLASFEGIRSLSLSDHYVLLIGLGLVVAFVVFIPFSMARQIYGTGAMKTAMIVGLAVVLKYFIAILPSAGALVFSGGGATG